MQLLIQAAMIFFGTLFAAGLLALVEPQSAAGAATPHAVAAPASAQPHR